ncbi:MAG: DMT family transporter [Paludibacteraceae bacterium]|nr:DMT family transporter [Paludibacteraceae bacterium]
MNSKGTTAVIALVIAQIFWGTSYVLSEYALHVFSPATLVTIRLTIAALLLGFITVATGNLVRIPWRHYRWFLVAALCEPFIYFLCEVLALQRVSSMVTSVILAFIPLITPFLTYFFIKEKITVPAILGAIISIVGVMMVIIDKGGEVNVNMVGVILLVIAMIVAIGYALIIRKVPDEYNTLCVVFYMFCTALIYFVPTSLITERTEIAGVFAMFREDPETVLNALYAIICLAITASCIAFLFYSYGVRVLGPNKASVYNSIQPAITALFAWMFLSQEMTCMKVVGIAIVVIGLFVSQINTDKL